MSNRRNKTESSRIPCLEGRLASYLTASTGIGAMMASGAEAVVVSSTTLQSIAAPNDVVSIDFNSDGQTDFQIDHDRVDLTPQGGPIVDYLQVDKNDINGENNPLDFDPGPNTFLAATPFQDGASPRNDASHAAFVVEMPHANQFAQYPSALLAGTEIGPNSVFDFQEGDNIFGSQKWGRFNRLIDEDAGKVDMLLGGRTADQIYAPANAPQFLAVENEVRYLGVRLDLNDASTTNTPESFTYGWIGIRVTDEDQALADIVGWGYETEPGVSILAGELAPGTPGDYNNNGTVDAADYVLWRNGGPLANEIDNPGVVEPGDYTAWRAAFGNPGPGFTAGATVPEPGSALLGLISGFALVFVYFCRKVRAR